MINTYIQRDHRVILMTPYLVVLVTNPDVFIYIEQLSSCKWPVSLQVRKGMACDMYISHLHHICVALGHRPRNQPRVKDETAGEARFGSSWDMVTANLS